MKKFLVILLFTLCNFVFAQTLLLYGGKNHDIFLGCLNCPSYDTKSIWCNYGDYGSNYGTKSIWTNYGDYGSNYSSLSPWTTYADKPPVVVDTEGNFYGYLTLNKGISKRANFKLANILYEYHDLIRKDVDGWYKKLFK